MAERPSIAGRWWAAARPHEWVAGRLATAPSDMSLELIGHLAGPADIVGPYEFPLVYGSGDACHVTLRGCHITGTSFSMPVETQRETAVVETALIGAHVAEFIVTELEVGFEHMAVWTLLPTPMVTPTASPDGGPAVRIEYAAPAPLEAAIGTDLVRLEFSWTPRRSPAGDLAIERPVRFVVRLWEIRVAAQYAPASIRAEWTGVTNRTTGGPDIWIPAFNAEIQVKTVGPRPDIATDYGAIFGALDDGQGQLAKRVPRPVTV